MPRLRIIVLDQPEDSSTYRYAMWADVPSARQKYYADANLVSVWRDALTSDNTNLQSGAVTEHVGTIRIPSGTTLAQIETFMQARWQDFQASITNGNPWIRYGTTWDGTAWTIVTGA